MAVSDCGRGVLRLHVGSGAFDLRLMPVAGGFTISGQLEGPVTLVQ